MIAAAVCVCVMAAAGLFIGRTLLVRDGAEIGYDRAWRLAAAFTAVALMPVVMVGAVIAWRTGRPLREDARDATEFLWLLIALSVVALVGIGLPTGTGADLLQRGLAGGAALALIATGWLAARKGDWAGGWTFVPMVGGAVLGAVSLDELTIFAQQTASGEGMLWTTIVVLAWASLTTGLFLALAGLAVRRQETRRRRMAHTLRQDTNLLCTGGKVAIALAGALLLASVAGNATVRAELLGFGQATGQSAAQLLAACTGTAIARALLRALTPLANGLSAVLSPLAWCLILAIALVLHVLAGARIRWAMHSVAAIWTLPLACFVALTCLFGLNSLLPSGEAGLAMPVVRFLATHTAARLVVLAVVVAFANRWWECVRSAWEISHSSPAVAQSTNRTYVPGADGPATRRHVAFLSGCALLLSACVPAALLVVDPGPTLSPILLELGELGRDLAAEAYEFCSHVGLLASQSNVNAVAAGLVAVGLIGIHRESLRGQASIYPLVGGTWLLLLVALVLWWLRNLWRQPAPVGTSVAVALAAAAVPVMLVLLALVLLVRQWRRAAALEDTASDMTADPSGAARCLGLVGLLTVCLGTLVAIDAALAARPWYSALAVRLAGGIQSLFYHALLGVARILETIDSVGWLGASGMVAGAVALLVVHCCSLHGSRRAGIAVFAFWAGAVVVGLVAGVYWLSGTPMGEWSWLRIMAASALAALWLRLFVALAAGAPWVGRGRKNGPAEKPGQLSDA
jgi:hypothetical protein